MNFQEHSVEMKPEVLMAPEPVSPLDLRMDGRATGPAGDPDAWERRLQHELLLIQKQQQIQKQLLISEFQKQHESLTRQHQAQLQEHLKLQQELLAMKQQQQEHLEKERRLEQRSQEREREQEQEQEREQERERERRRREKHLLILRNKERARESAVASTEVKQKLQDFLLNKPAKDLLSNGSDHRPKLWYMSTQHMSMDQSPPTLGEVSPTYKYTLPPGPDSKDDFPLRKTASEPNLKVRSRLKQKVAERRSSPLMRRKDGSVVIAPYKKRALEFIDSIASNSAPGSGPSSPNGVCSDLGADNGTSSLPTTAQTERLHSHHRNLRPEDSMTMLTLYTSPSLPNITLGLPGTSSPIRAATALKETQGDGCSGGSGRQPVAGQFLGAIPPVALETKVSSSHQALLQHLLLKEQMRQQKILPPGMGGVSVLSPSPLAMRDRTTPTVRQKLPRHRPLNRTQSAPLPQSTLAQLVIQQQHQSFVEKQKQYHQQIHINQMLSQSIEQLRQPSAHLQEEDEDEHREKGLWHALPPGGVIRKHSQSSSSSGSSSDGEPPEAHLVIAKVKEEPPDSEEETAEQSPHLRPLEGEDVPRRLVIRAII